MIKITTNTDTTNTSRICLFLGSLVFMLGGVWSLAFISTILPYGVGFWFAQIFTWILVLVLGVMGIVASLSD